MAYNYVEESFIIETTPSSNTSMLQGSNAICGFLKDFILTYFPDTSVYSDNDPTINSDGYSYTQRTIYITFRGAVRICLSARKHSASAKYGFADIKLVNDEGLELGTFSCTPVGNLAIVTGFFVDDVCYALKSHLNNFEALSGFLISDSGEYTLITTGQVRPVTNSYTFNIKPSGAQPYDMYINNKIILTEYMIEKSSPNEPRVLRFKNKKVFKPGILNYFSHNKFYAGDDGHLYAYLCGMADADSRFLVQLE